MSMDLSGRDVRRATALPGLAVDGYLPHALHGGDAHWLEKNCYVDLWIELLHAQGLDPHALWPAAVALDFEGDQWTFLKPPHGELRALYGIDVQELTVWRPLSGHAIEHLGAGRPLSIEADAFWLPDTAGTDYHQNHTKTTIVLNEVDLDARRIAYFHNAGYFEARDDDVTQLLAGGPLPLYAEFIRTDRRVARSTEELQMLALQHLVDHLAFLPATNPVRRFAARLADDLPLLREYGLGYYHQWAFGTVRQLGAAFELAARGLAWQGAPAGSPLHDAARAFDRVARDSKTLILKLARAVASPRPADLSPLLDGMAQAWDEGMAALDAA
ncbi:MAG: DUF1839 family protein [Caulobacter sp.]|nr:DUF1839 family protein [Vitreoscilla sp.]